METKIFMKKLNEYLIINKITDFTTEELINLPLETLEDAALLYKIVLSKQMKFRYALRKLIAYSDDLEVLLQCFFPKSWNSYGINDQNVYEEHSSDIQNVIGNASDMYSLIEVYKLNKILEFYLTYGNKEFLDMCKLPEIKIKGNIIPLIKSIDLNYVSQNSNDDTCYPRCIEEDAKVFKEYITDILKDNHL